MRQDEIIDMAIQAGASPDENKIWLMYAEEIETFAKLVAAKAYEKGVAAFTEAVSLEREACAKLIDPTEEHRKDASWGYIGGNEGVEMLDELAALIRARGEA